MAFPQVDERQITGNPLIDYPVAPGPTETPAIPDTEHTFKIGAYTISTSHFKAGPYTVIHKVLGVEGKEHTRVTALEILDPHDYTESSPDHFQKLAKVLHIRVRNDGKFWYLVHLRPFEDLKPLPSLIFRQNK